MTRTRLVGFVVGLALSVATTVHADPVTDWNGIAVSAVTIGRGGPPGLLDLAVVHTAMHDAVQAIEGRYRPYHYAGAGSGSTAAAAVAAAHRALVLLYPGQAGALDATYNAYLAEHGLAGDPGLAVGEAAAASVHAAHYRPVLVVPAHPIDSTGVGEWRSPVPMGFLYLAYSTPFTLNRADQFRPPPPPPVGSMAYTRDYDEVKALGKNSAHPNVNTDVAWFWSANFVAQWNETARQLASAHLTEIGDSARLFALINLAGADAAMAVWDSKRFYNFWRPVTAVQQGDHDGNDRTTGDAGWGSLLNAPPYPDYVSGANGLTGAFTGMLRLFFNRDEMQFTVKTTAPNAEDKERDYTSFSQAAQEVVEARILLGIHFRFADTEARRLGERVAHWTFQKFLGPAPGSK
jgi:hypothetical protein